MKEVRPARELRCHCGSLIARIVDGKVELKCRRCQRIGLIALPAAGAEPESIAIEWLDAVARVKPR